MSTPEIHPQLLADCHHLGRLPASELLLHRNNCLPWFILVPDTQLADVLDLAEDARNAVMTDCAAISAFIKQGLGFAKVNFAGLGNQVPQMHLHLVGRQAGDACWPQPIWGNLPEGAPYSEERLLRLQSELVEHCGLEARR